MRILDVSRTGRLGQDRSNNAEAGDDLIKETREMRNEAINEWFSETSEAILEMAKSGREEDARNAWAELGRIREEIWKNYM